MKVRLAQSFEEGAYALCPSCGGYGHAGADHPEDDFVWVIVEEESPHDL